MSVLVGDNGLAFGDNGEPTIISIGPGTRSMSGSLESNWTTGGFLLIKDGTDEALYVHPSNTYFNLDLPTALRSEYEYDNRPNITGYQAFTLIDITSKYLQGLVTSAQSILEQNITLAVVVFPDGQNVRTTAKEIINHKFKGNYTHYDSVVVGRFNSPWSEARMLAEALAGVGAQGIYSEQLRKTSAAIFPFSHHMEYSRGVLVYRLGSSTFEVSVLKVDGGSTYTMSSVYDQRLGGNDFNQRVVDHLLLAHKNKTSQELHSEDMYLLRLGNEVEKAKRVLSVQDVVRIEIESPHPGGQDLSEQLTRSQFEDLNMDLFTKTITAIDQAIKDSVVYTKDDIQDIVFSGGSANIPFLQLAVREYFGRHKRYHGSNHPETTVVSGAAKRGHWYQDERHYGGIECCLGERRRTLGIETTGGVMFKYTDRTSGLHIDKMYTFSTVLDNQDRVIIRVFSGNGKWTNQNTFLGGVELTGIAPSPKGVPQIRVRLSTYSCGRSINLNVMDVASGRTNATIFPLWPRFDDFEEKINYGMLEGGAFELEPAGKLILLPEYQ
ncbi:ATPase with role in protein import into the ER [Linnemannia gamsii]|jgi:molecular chaperone DnaK (HSP70)|uniref:ATPase with role in protein import into the ER n=1 Tax=Linnemannia gamsii TaxID=64522 RepID=A0A9P6UJB0_9FUNG|nr:ATPase with role in protein import into the ER [Linnemannia gamsii]